MVAFLLGTNLAFAVEHGGTDMGAAPKAKKKSTARAKRLSRKPAPAPAAASAVAGK